MKKRILPGLLALCIALSLLPTGAFAADGDGAEPWAEREEAALPAQPGEEPAPAPVEPDEETAVLAAYDVTYAVEGGNLYFDSSTGTITDCDATVTSADIPAEIEGVVVTGIGEFAFSYCRSMVSITIPESVTSIGTHAFNNCSSLTSVTIPDSVTSLGSWSFSYCSRLTKLVISKYTTNIGSFACNGCSGLSNAGPIGGGYNYEFGWTSSIPDYAFHYCSSLTSVAIPDSVTDIGPSAFSGCSSLESVSIPDSVTSIGILAFSGCSSLESVSIPDSVTSIGISAFSDCSSLMSAGPIGGGYNCEFGWRNSIPDYAFYNCNNLTNVTIPDGVTSIGNSAFNNCSNLSKLVVPGSVTIIGHRSFSGCSSLTSAGPIGGDYDYEFGWTGGIPDYAFCLCSNLTNVSIPNGIRNIGSSAFSGTALTDITIPASVIRLDNAFDGCNSLLKIDVDSGNTQYASEGGALLTEAKTEILCCPKGKTSYIIPECVTSIGNSAFFGCTKLTNLVIPGNVDSIGSRAYSGCTELTSLTIEAGVTSIGSYAFSGCTKLTEIDIPGSMANISYNTFSDCTNLTQATLENGVTSVASGMFYNCSALTELYLPVSVTSIGSNAFYDCYNLTTITYSGTKTQWGQIKINSENRELNAATLICTGKAISEILLPTALTATNGDLTGTCLVTADLSSDTDTLIYAACYDKNSKLLGIEQPDTEWDEEAEALTLTLTGAISLGNAARDSLTLKVFFVDETWVPQCEAVTVALDLSQ